MLDFPYKNFLIRVSIMEELYSVDLARRATELAHGSPVSAIDWASWRKRAGILVGVREVELDPIVRLIVIAKWKATQSRQLSAAVIESRSGSAEFINGAIGYIESARSNGPSFGARMFHSSMVRRACDHIYGRAMSDDSWRKWKVTIGLSGGDQEFTFEQFCQIGAIAQIKKKDSYKPIDMRSVKVIGGSDRMIRQIGGLIQSIDDSGWAMGWGIADILGLRGVKVDRSTLKAAVPGLRPNAWYQADEVIRMLRDFRRDGKDFAT